MTRPCRITNCTRTARPGRHICGMHKQRIALHGDPHFHTWHTTDPHAVAAIIREQRPTLGLTRLERLQVAQGLTELHISAQEIARIVGVQPRTVYRWRSQGFRQAA